MVVVAVVLVVAVVVVVAVVLVIEVVWLVVSVVVPVVVHATTKEDAVRYAVEQSLDAPPRMSNNGILQLTSLAS